MSDIRTMENRLRVDAGAALAVIGYSAALNRRIPPALHIPANLAAAGAATLAVRAAGASWEELGLARSHLARGARAGLAAAAPVLAATAIGAALPATRRHFDDPRVLAVERPVFEVLFRIPLGTALCEELIFRGALLALYERHRSERTALLATSAVFGLWHVFPAFEFRSVNADRTGSRPSPGARSLGVVAVTVLTTAAAGVGFGWLRRRSRSIVAPVLLHTAINAGGFTAVHWNRRRVAISPPGR
jgi:membrane protease YdiL (CAAX protease family)